MKDSVDECSKHWCLSTEYNFRDQEFFTHPQNYYNLQFCPPWEWRIKQPGIIYNFTQHTHNAFTFGGHKTVHFLFHPGSYSIPRSCVKSPSDPTAKCYMFWWKHTYHLLYALLSNLIMSSMRLTLFVFPKGRCGILPVGVSSRNKCHSTGYSRHQSLIMSFFIM